MRTDRLDSVASLVVLSGLVMGACAGVTPTPSISSPTATATVVASPIVATSATPKPPPTAQSSPTAKPSQAVTALPEGGNTVLPGTYTTHFQPVLTLTVGREVELSCVSGHECRGDVDVNLSSWVGLEFGDEPAFEVNIDRIDMVWDLKHPGSVMNPPKDLARWISTLPGVTLIAPSKSTQVGGLHGTQLDIMTGAKVAGFGPISGVTDLEGFGPAPNRPLRIIVVSVAGHDVLITVGASNDDPLQFKAATEALQPLVDSIAWQ